MKKWRRNLWIVIAVLLTTMGTIVGNAANNSYKEAVNRINAQNPKQQIQIYRYDSSFKKYKTGLCNVSSITTLLNRRLAYDGKTGESFSVKEVLTSCGCSSIKNSGNKWYYIGDTGGWASKTYKNGNGTTYSAVRIDDSTVKKATSKANFYEYIAKLLHEHPEGIAIRNTKANHVAVIYYYEKTSNGIQLYVKDPANNYSGKLEGSHIYKQSGKDLYTKLDCLSYLKGSKAAGDDPNISVSGSGDGGVTPITSKPATVGSGYTTSGSAVKTLQTALNKVNNAGLTVDGKYGNNTKNAIINYQKKKGLTADGICGPKTWEKLIADYNALIKYTVTFDANGGNGAPGNQSKTYGQNLTLSSTKPTRTGHAFQGWATSSGGSVAYQPGGTYSNNAAITLYAVWKVDSYTVSYNANGGSGAPGNQTKTYGQNLTLSSAKPTRTGYTFQGWATSAGGSVAYQPGATYSNNAAVTLYAVWNVDTYTVSYNANGGSGAPANQTKTYGQNLTLSSTRPTRDGYTFQGWATSAGGAATYQPGSNYSDNAAVTLYAVWKETSSVKTYTISYKVPEGQVAPEPQIKTHGVNLKLTTFVPVAPKGHSFVGWLNYPAAIKGNEPIYGPGAFYYEDSSATLTAVFEPNKYRISYEANGGSGVPGYQIKRYGNDISISQLVPEREGYTFQGWATSAGGTAVYQPGSTYSDNADVTLYAVWKQNGDAKRLPGDVNDDGKVSLLDLARLCKYLAGYNVNIHELNSDVNGDGKVSLLDLARLCKYLAGYDVVLK